MATAYALNLWADICADEDASQLAREFKARAAEINQAVNRHLWDGQWFGRGITDDGVVFGTSKDKEGRIFLNPQSWAILSRSRQPGAARTHDPGRGGATGDTLRRDAPRAGFHRHARGHWPRHSEIPRLGRERLRL